ncbi:MAG: hypothetical protein H0W62_10870 [Chitinophagales bacterium]|nr:hypothetical protein [Chitinophagales bacterium]
MGRKINLNPNITPPNAYTIGLWNEGNSCTNMAEGVNKLIGSTYYSTIPPLDPNGTYTYTVQLENACGISSCLPEHLLLDLLLRTVQRNQLISNVPATQLF